jgi:phosphopantothenoylcysteine decarboxylase / phosphopantothenate---cysteine ligase
MRILITAGATRQYIDPVRFISNASSGKMGLALARAALKLGHTVTFVTTVNKPELRTQNSELRIIKVETAEGMFKAVKKHFAECDCLIMAAAVADYTPVKPAKTKLKKSSESLTIKLKPTADILLWAGKHKKVKSKKAIGKKRILVGFALEDKSLRRNAEKKLVGKNLDMIVANSPAAVGAEKSAVQIKIHGQDWISLEKMKKTAIAMRIIEQVNIFYQNDRMCTVRKR